MKLNYNYSTDKDISKFTHNTGKFWCVIIIMFMVVSRDQTFYRLLCEPSKNFTKILGVIFCRGKTNASFSWLLIICNQLTLNQKVAGNAVAGQWAYCSPLAKKKKNEK